MRNLFEEERAAREAEEAAKLAEEEPSAKEAATLAEEERKAEELAKLAQEGSCRNLRWDLWEPAQ